MNNKKIQDRITYGLEFINNSFIPNYGWPYIIGNDQPWVEPTAWALRALNIQPTRFSNTISRCLEFIFLSQNEDGGWGNHFESESDIFTALIVSALLECTNSINNTNLDRGIKWLINQKTIKGRYSSGGWPWTKNSYAFTESSCMAYIALLKAGKAPDSHDFMIFLKENQCEDYGWSCHANSVLGKQQPSQPEPTIISCYTMSLLGILEETDIGRKGIKALLDYLPLPISDFNLALALLSINSLSKIRESYGVPVVKRILNKQLQNGSWQNNILGTSTTIIALWSFSCD